MVVRFPLHASLVVFTAIALAIALAIAPGAPAQELKGGWQVPVGGWTYAYEAADGESRCDLLAGGAGPPCEARLDGAWNPLPSSDQWDGSGIGSGEGAPGGMQIASLAGKGDGGGDASVLRITDPGDPRDNGFPDPGNRKIYNGYDLAASGVDADTNVFDGGLTMLFRFRQLAPSEIDPFDLTDPDPDGPGYAPFSSLKSVLGVVSRALGLTSNLGFTVLDGKLALNNVASAVEPRVEVPLCDPTGFVSVWATALNEGGQIHLTLWTDGALAPAFDGLVTLGADADNFPGGQRNNYLYLGLGSTGQAGAFDIDYLCFLEGTLDPTGPAATLHCPRGIACKSSFDGRTSSVEVTWANASAYDAHEILRDGAVITTIGGGRESFTDVNPPAGARTYQLNSKKGAQQCAGACAGLSCTVNVTGLPVQCITDLQCSFDGAFHVWTWKNNDAYTALQMRILLELGEVAGAGGTPCVDAGLLELVNDPLPPATESVSSSVFGANQLTPGSIAVIELVAMKNLEACDPVTVECKRDSLCPADLACTLDGTMVNASWTAGAGLSALTIQLEGSAAVDLDPTSASAALDASGLAGVVTVTLTPVACVGDCGPASCQVEVGKVERFKRGDADAKGSLNITDGIFLLNFLFLGGAAPPCPDAADGNDDQALNISDGIFILNYLFIGGATPPPPGPEGCGKDPTPDALSACTYESC